MKIYFATDHAGFEMKEALVPFVRELGHDVEDMGAFHFYPNDDYTDMIPLAAKKVSQSAGSARGIILGGSGQGEAMVANRYPHVRAAVYYGGNKDVITLSREHNNANILSLGARMLTIPEAKDAVKIWLETPFSQDERHLRRLKKIDTLGG